MATWLQKPAFIPNSLQKVDIVLTGEAKGCKQNRLLKARHRWTN